MKPRLIINSKILLAGIIACLFQVVAVSDDALSAGNYIFHPDALYCKEKLVFNQYYLGIWHKKDGKMKFRFNFENVESQQKKKGASTIQILTKEQNGINGERIVNLTPEGLILKYKFKIKPAPGYGEIGFYIQPEFILGKEGKAKILVNGKKAKEITTETKKRHIVSLKSGVLEIKGKNKLFIASDGLEFTGSHGAHLQDYRDSARKAIRYVVSFNTSRGCEFNLSLRMGVGKAPVSKNIPVLIESKTSHSKIKSETKPMAKGSFKMNFERPKLFVFNGEKVNIKMTCLNPLPEEKEYSVDWRIVNESGKEMEKGKFQAKSSKDFKHPFVFDIMRNGSYRLEVSAKDKGGNISRGEALFSVLPKPLTEHPSNGMLGATGISSRPWGIKLAKACGLTWHRRHCGFTDTRFSRVMKNGELDLDYLKEGEEREKKHGFTPLGSLLLSSRGKKQANLNWEKDFDKYMDVWLNVYVIPMVKASKGHIRYWEVGNEPYYEFRKNPEIYVEILKRTYKAIKEIDPEIKVVGLCGPPKCIGEKWYRDTFKLGALKYMDVLSFHQYCFSNKLISSPENSFFSWFAKIRKLIKEYGEKDIEIWNDESSLTPPSTMYTLPKNIKNVNYRDGRKSPDGREQAAVMVRILTAHYSAGVKYIFHLFGGNSTYSCHPCEFDCSPIPLSVSMAASNRFMEGKKPLGEVVFKKRLKGYLFKGKNNGATAVIWLEKLYPDDSAKISLPTELARNSVYDIFANKIQENVKELTVKPEPVFISFDSKLDAKQFRKIFEQSIPAIKESSESIAVAGVKKANPSDWVGFYSVDLAPYANRSFKDEDAGDQKGGFTDEGDNDLRMLKGGDYVANNIPFHILDAAKNNDKSCIVLGGKMREYFPKEVKGIAIGKDGKGKRLSILHFLHMTTNAYLARNKPVFKYVVHYADGSEEKIEVKDKYNIADWYYPKDLPDAKVAFRLPNLHTDEVCIFHHEWSISNKLGAHARIVSIDIISEGSGAIPVIVAITGVYSN